MDWKIYTCDCLNNYPTTLELEELDDFLNKTKNPNNKQTKKQQRGTRTLSVSGGRSAFIFFFYERPEKQVRIIRKYHNHTLQTKTRPDIIIHFIKQRDQFHFERKLYAHKCMSISVFFVPNFVVQHVNCFVVCCIKTTRYKRKGPSYLWVMWHTMLISVYASVIIRHLVMSPFKSTYFQIFLAKITVAKQ